MLVTGVLRISLHDLHSPHRLELALAESPYPLGRGFLHSSLMRKLAWLRVL